MQSSVHQGRTWLYRFHPHVHSAALWEPPGQKALVGPVKTHWINADFSFEEQSPVFSHKKTSGFIAHYKDIMINETLQIMKKNNNLHMMIHIMEFFFIRRTNRVKWNMTRLGLIINRPLPHKLFPLMSEANPLCHRGQ